METTTPNYEVDFEDERLQAVDDKYAGLESEYDKTSQDMIDQSDDLYQGLIDENKRWAEEQKQLQQEQTDFTIEQIEQQKEQAHKDYIKEQSGAYKDWQKQSNQYGVNAEQMASSGMTNTGFSESSQVSMYNTYQNRVSTARESYNQAVLNYNNSIKEARLQNNSILAEIAHNALQEQAKYIIEGALYKNNLILERANKKLELESMRNQEWYQVLAQINSENAMKEEVRQFEASQAFQKEMAELDQANKLAYLDAQTEAEKELWDYKNSNPTSDEDDKEEDEETGGNSNTGGSVLIDKPSGGSGDGDTEVDTTGGDEGSEIPVNYDSMLALGVGKLTEAELAELVAQDYVIMTIENGQYVFRWSQTKEAQNRKTQLENRYKDQVERDIKEIVDEIKGNYEVITEYYRGKKNTDVYVYGAFENGYQPKGIADHGKLKATGKTITFATTTLDGEEKTVTQKVWEAEDGTWWYWDGRLNKYVRFVLDEKNTSVPTSKLTDSPQLDPWRRNNNIFATYE